MPLNALVCEDGHTKTFYSVDTDKLRAAASTTGTLKLPHWVEYQIGSLAKASALRGLSSYLSNSGRRHFASINAEDFLREEQLECVSLLGILERAGMQAEEVEVLAVDVEGYDAHVVLGSFDVPGLEPET